MTTLNDALVDIIQKTQGAVESGVSFLSQQIPEVIQQLLMWKFYSNLVEGTVSLVLAMVIITLMVKWAKSLIKLPRDIWSDPWFPFFMVSIAVIPTAVMSAINSFCCYLNALQIYIAPKVWLIEYAAHLAK